MDRKKRTLLMLVMLLVMAVVAVAGGLLLWNKQKAPEQTEVTQTLPTPNRDDDSKKEETYKILVKNAKGSPIQGIIAAFYDKDGNVVGEPGTTNNMGAITLKTEDKNIASAKVLAVPYEYELNKELYEFKSSKKSVSIVLNENSNAYIAQIGDEVLLFKDAIAKANASETDVTIKLLGDVHYAQSFHLYNVNGKTITLDGQGHTLNLYTTSHSIKVYQNSGTINIQNMKIEHGGLGNLIVVGTTDKETALSSRVLNVNLSNLDIVSESTHAYTLINTKRMQTINMNLSKVNLVWKTANEVKGGAIMPGVSGMDQVLNLTLKDSVIDVRQANGARGINAANKVTGEINLINTKILTSNGAKPVSKGKMTLTRDAASYLNDGTPDEAKIGDTIYNKLTEAMEAANKSETDVTITLLNDAKIEQHLLFENANGKNIILNGAGHTLTAATTGHSMYVHQKTGTVDIINMKIVHSGEGNVLRIGKKKNTELSEDLVTVNLTNLDILSSSTHEYTLIHTNESQKIDLNMSNVNLVWDTEREDIKGGAIMGSVSGLKQELNLTMRDCTVDVTKANGAKGIYAANAATGNIILYNTVIKTMKTEAVANNNMTLAIDTATSFNNGTADEVAIGTVKYNTLEEALLDANASATDVNITMLRDMEIYEPIIVNNANGKNITFDGCNKSLVADRPIYVNQKAGTIELKNMKITHSGTEPVLRIGDRNATYTEKLTVNLNALDIDSTSSCVYGLIQAGYGTMELDLNMADVDLAWKTEADVQKGAILAGLSGETTKLNLTMTESDIDSSKVSGAYGISAESGVTGNLVLNDTTIKSNKDSVVDKNMKFTRNTATELSSYPTTQVKVGDVVYNEFSEAIADANKADKDVTISFLSDEVTLKSDVTIKNANGNKIAVDGCNNKLVTNKSIFINQKAGTVEFINMDVKHSGSAPMLRIGDRETSYTEKLTVNLNALNIDSESEYQFGLIQAGYGAMALDLNMNSVDVTWNTTKTVQKGAIMAGVSGLKTELNLTMTDCTIDTSSTNGAYGISAESQVTGNLVLNNTNIKSNTDSVFDRNMKLTRDTATKLSTYPATQVQIGDVVYNELGEAIADANNSQEDVTISFLSDEVTLKSDITIDNVNGKKITVDGCNKVLVTNKSILVNQKSGTVEFINMNVKHSGTGPVLRIGDRNATYTEKLTVNLNALNISSESSCVYGLIQAGYATMTLDLDMTDVDIAWDTTADVQKGAIFAGLSGKTTTLNLTMTDCEIDVAKANNAKAIHAENGVTGAITFNTSTVKTNGANAIANNRMTLNIDKDTTFYQGTTQSVTLVDGVQYSELTDAVTAMNAKTTDATMNLVKDVTHKSQIKLKLANQSATITINGNGHTLTGDFKDVTDNHFIYFEKHLGTVNLNNITIEHKNTDKNLITFGSSSTTDNTKTMVVNFKDVTMRSESTNAYSIINAVQLTNFDITLGNVTLNWETTADANASRAAIRYGNSGSGRTVTLDIKDSTLDMSGAVGSGIVYAPSGFNTNSRISVQNSVIKPYAGQDAYKGTADDFAPAVYMEKNGYPTLAEAVSVANNSTEDVTITMIRNVEIAGDITVNNVNGKKVTVDGCNKTLDTAYKIVVNQKAGIVDFKNMKITHRGNGPVLRIGDRDATYEKKLTVNLNALDIDSESSCVYGLIQAGYATMTLDLNMTDVDLAWKTTAEVEKGAIFAGLSGKITALNLAMSDCVIDVTEANGKDADGAKAIHAENGVTGAITFNTTSVKTKGADVIANNKMTLTIDKDTTFYQGETQSVALVDGVQYSQLTAAVTAMNAKTTDATMYLVKDVTHKSQIKINVANNQSGTITINGNGHTLTGDFKDGGDAHFIYFEKHLGTVNLNNITIEHKNTGNNLITFGNGNTQDDTKKMVVNLKDVTMNSESTNKYAIINAVQLTNFDITLDNVTLDWETTAAADAARAAIRYGNNVKPKRTVNLVIKNSTLDMSKAKDSGIVYAPNAILDGSTISVEDSTIAPYAGQDAYKEKAANFLNE